jgi:hypothetical protein
LKRRFDDLCELEKMKTVKVDPFGVFKVTQEVLDTIEKNVASNINPKKATKEIIQNIKKTKSGTFFGISPETGEMFTFVPIVEKDELFAANFPDPIQLYFSLAFENYQYANRTRASITFQSGQSGSLNFVNSHLYNWHIKYKISTIIFLHSTIEAFINYLMPEDFIYKQDLLGKKSDKFTRTKTEYSKEQTERFIQFKEKLNQVIPQLTQISFFDSHKKTYDKLLNLNTYRNDLIHLRSTRSQNKQHFQKVFDEVINVDLKQYVEAVIDFINVIKPNHIKFIETKPTKQSVFEFNFEAQAAFPFDISVFLKILDVPTKKVNLNIPKLEDEGKDFQVTMNWIMQNLGVMADQNLIHLADIKEDTKDRVVIEITKTEKKLGQQP